MHPGWRILSYRIAAEGSRHRVGIWRELRRVGAVSLQAATWALPAGQGFDEAVTRAVELVERAEGVAFIFDVVPDEATASQLESMFVAEREEEWSEFLTECAKAIAEIAEWTNREKFTLAQLDEEEHNHERLRRWYRELRAKDLFGAPSASGAEQRLKESETVLEQYAERVYLERQS